MATNKYFNLYKTNTNEQKLVRDFVTESIQIYGQDLYYVLRTIDKEDYLFLEDVLSHFEEYYEIEMYLENYEGFEGGTDLLSKFGFEIPDQMTFVVSRDRFLEETGMAMPREGDLIYLPLAKIIFEIKFVEDEDQFYPVGTLAMFKLNCEVMRYNNQEFNTGIEDIDIIEAELDLGSGAESIIGDNSELETEGSSILDKNDNNPWGSY